MRKRLFRSLNRLAGKDPRKIDYIKGVLYSWLERDKSSRFRGYITRERRSTVKSTPDHFMVKHIALSRRSAINAFDGTRTLGADFIVAVPHSPAMERDITKLSSFPAEYYNTSVGMDWDWIELRATSARYWNVRIRISPAYWRSVKEIGVQYHNGRLVQSVTNKRAHGEYTAWDVNYFDIRDKKNPKYIKGCFVRRGDIWSLGPDFSSAYNDCKHKHTMAALEALKETLDDDGSADVG